MHEKDKYKCRVEDVHEKDKYKYRVEDVHEKDKYKCRVEDVHEKNKYIYRVEDVHEKINIYTEWKRYMEEEILNNGVRMPLIGIGTWCIQGKNVKNNIENAIIAGYRLFDTAQMYGNEKEVGQALKNVPGLSREKLFITTKISHSCKSVEDTIESFENSLKSLETDYVDLILIHEPYQNFIQMYQALEKIYKSGKARAIGVSNFNMSEIEMLISNSEVVPMVNQIESHVYYPQLDMKKEMDRLGICMQSWGPFAEGKKGIFNDETLKQIGQKYRKTPAQVALRYLVQNGIMIIPKSSQPEHMKENLDIFDFELTSHDKKNIAKLDEQKSLFGW